MNLAPKTVSGFFIEDHRAIDDLFNEVKFESAPKDLERFEEFWKRLSRHIAWEEERLFPEACRRSESLRYGPAEVMLSEHKTIRALAAETLAALKRGDLKTAREKAGMLEDTLGSHNMKEENIFYPACDGVLDRGQIDELLRDLEREAKHGP